MDRVFLGIGALSGFLAVAAGAFGAHTLSGRIAPALLETFKTGAQYQMYHALALFAVAFAIGRWAAGPAVAAGWLFVAGTILFSGSLYALSLTGARWLGAITPFGGLAFLAGWLLLLVAALRA